MAAVGRVPPIVVLSFREVARYVSGACSRPEEVLICIESQALHSGEVRPAILVPAHGGESRDGSERQRYVLLKPLLLLLLLLLSEHPDDVLTGGRAESAVGCARD